MSHVTESPAIVAEQRPRLAIGEDWLAVWIGAVLIVAVVLGIRLAPPQLTWSGLADAASLASPGNLLRAAQLLVLLLVPSTVGAMLLGARPAPFAAGFCLLFVLALAAQALAGHSAASALGLEYVLFALVAGLVIRQTMPVPAWLLEAARSEFYIKIGLVVLGASVLFDEMIRAGALGMAQALIVVLTVWSFAFWLAKRLRVDDEFAAMLSSAVAICGVSAAIAACGAIQGDRKKLSYVSSLVLVVAVPMMVVMPWIVAATGMNEVVAGAWLGGTLDTSAAVVAAGELVSEPARDAAVVVKLSQNALIGVAAFALTLWWAMRKDRDAAATASTPDSGSRLAMIWNRFPKFVLGFIAVSFVFSFLLPDAAVAGSRGTLGAVRTALFAIAFISIGLETSIGDLVTTGEGRPAAAFLGAQAFNIVVTLIAAYLIFGGILLPAPNLG